MENNIVYGIEQTEDHESGGVTTIFSTYEKAKEYILKIKLDSTSSVEILEMEIDNPSYKVKSFDYNHG